MQRILLRFRYIMELWAMAFPTVALASALLQGTVIPVDDELLSTLLVPRWIAIFVVCLSLLITTVLSVWLIISLWRRQPKGIFEVRSLSPQFLTGKPTLTLTKRVCPPTILWRLLPVILHSVTSPLLLPCRTH